MNRMEFLVKAEKDLRNAVDVKTDNADRKIWDFFLGNPLPYNDVSVHDLAGLMGLEPDEVEERIYNTLGGLINGGISKGKRPEGLSEEVLAQGMKVESEHSANPLIQAKIVYDHVTELGNEYYAELDAMEKRLKEKNG